MSDLTDAVASGDRIASLSALRDRLAREIDRCDSPRDVAPLSRQLALVLAEIAELAPPEKKGTPLDQLAERRRSRGAETKGPDPAKGSAG